MSEIFVSVIEGTKIKVIKGDITEENVDAK